MASKRVSIIVPAYNEESVIEKCLVTLKNQSYKNSEIIVVDDGSTDRTRDIIKGIGGIKLIKGEHKGPGFSRNLGAKHAKGKILVFLDADMYFDKDYIKYLIKPILEKGVVGTAEETQLVANLDNVWSRCLGKVIANSETKERIIFRAIQKREFFKMGGFDPKYGYADDQTFWIKYKVKSVVAKKAVCYHKNPGTLKEVYNQSKWVGASLSYNYPILNIPGINFMILLLGYLSFPIAYPITTLARIFKKKDIALFFYYWPFMAVRYFGVLRGAYNLITLNKNVR